MTLETEHRSCPKAPTVVQEFVWLTDSSGTEWGAEALRVKRYVREGSSGKEICKRGSGKGYLSP
jgi:hypothetical protein